MMCGGVRSCAVPVHDTGKVASERIPCDACQITAVCKNLTGAEQTDMAGSSRRTRRLRRILVLIALIAVIADALLVIYLDRIVTPQFEGRRWTLPAQVFAQPLELYAGLALPADALEQELARLHYVPVDALTRPGTYHRRGSGIDVAT